MSGLEPSLHVLVEGAAVLDRPAAAEDHFRRLGRQLPAGLRRAGLDDDRPALDRPGDVERAADRQMLALMVEHVQLGRVEEDAALLVAQPGIVRPAVPEPRDHLVELAGAPVAFVVLDVVGQAEIERRVGVGGRHHVPAGPATADMVERGEAPGDVIGLVEGRRGGRDQADSLRHHGERRQQGQRLERGRGAAAPQRLDRHVQYGQVIRHEEGVEPRALQGLDEAAQVLEVEVRIGIGAGIAPPGGMDADRAHERTQMKLLRHRSPVCRDHRPEEMGTNNPALKR